MEINQRSRPFGLFPHLLMGVFLLPMTIVTEVVASSGDPWMDALNQITNNNGFQQEANTSIVHMHGQTGGSKRGGKGCRVDGTKCQFSTCGQGKLLPNCVIGFAAGVIGGRDGLSYVVNSADDNPHIPPVGTLRYAVELTRTNPKGVWITFARDMTIYLKEMLAVESHTTIDGRGVRVIITGNAINMRNAYNVILHNFQISDIHNFDTVHLFASSKVWVDHLTSFGGKLGLVSAISGSTDITISNCRLSNEHFNMLLGAANEDTIDQNMRITVYRNWFKDSNQRMPHCRWGYCHVMNNLYMNWGDYAIGGRVYAKILSERNVFVPGHNRDVTEWYPGYDSKWDSTSVVESKNDLFLNGAKIHITNRSGSPGAPPYKSGRDYPPLANQYRVARLIGYCSGVILPDKVRSCFIHG